MEKPVLFFSKNCTHSQQLWRYLSENRLLESFNKISVDNNPNIPPMVQSVPTIYIRGRPLITGQGVMMYVNSLRGGGASQQRQPPQQQQQSPMTVQNAPKDNSLQQHNEVIEGISAYHPSEMGGNWSDSYEYLQRNPNSEERIGHSFVFLKGTDQYSDSKGNPMGLTNPNTGMQMPSMPNQSAPARGLPPALQAQPMGKKRGGSDLDARYEMMMASRGGR
jgi:hypothetical protein